MKNSKLFLVSLLFILLVMFPERIIGNSQEFNSLINKYSIVIDANGTEDFTDIQSAVNSIPSGNSEFVSIFIRNGKYKGHVDIPEDKPFLHFVGESRDSVIITDDRLCGDPGNGSPWYKPAQGATVVINASDCIFENITFENSWGHEKQTGPQALAVYSNNDRIAFNQCTMRSFQDTYLTSTKNIQDRQYLLNCRIEGAVDFIYGGGNVLFDQCEIYCTRQNLGYIVAPNHRDGTKWGYVFLNCEINGKKDASTYFGRPWHNAPKTVFLNTKTSIHIDPRGWHKKMGAIPAVFADYNTMDMKGNPLDLSKRISEYEFDIKDADKKIIGVQKGSAKNTLTAEEAASYTYENINETWNPLDLFIIKLLPYQNAFLDFDSRAKDLVSRLTLEEKVSLMMDSSKPVERLGIKQYNWWNEALHGVARAGVATVFPQAIAMAASFDPDLVKQVFTVVSDEARAKNAKFVSEGSFKRYQGLTMWTPNINIFRDPRWGRGMETYGEDPFLTEKMGVAVVKGLQGDATSKYDKLHACAKHFAVHSGPEWNRHSFNAANIKGRDLYETYLPAFKALVQDADVKEVMCAYNRYENEPCCGSNTLLNSILRNDWGYKGIVVADCGAIADFYRPNAHSFSLNAAQASAQAVIAGTDIDCGSSYNALITSVKESMIEEKTIDKSVERLLKARFELGEMDPINQVSWSEIPYSVVASAKHDSLAYEMALNTLVLLKNAENILPLKNTKIKLAVIGPNANDSVMQWGNYNGTPVNTITLLEGIENSLDENSSLIYDKACELVVNTQFVSDFNSCEKDGVKGFKAKYWNNLKFDGSAIASAEMKTPFQLCTSGATVFAPGVNLKDFSATYSTKYTARESGDLVFDFYYCGMLNVSVDNSLVKSLKSNHGARSGEFVLAVEKGKIYDVKIDFAYTMGDAQLNFDLGFRKEMDRSSLMDKINDVDVVIFAGGISPSLEGEEMGVNFPGFKGGDRTDIELPKVQRDLLADIHKAGKKIVYVNFSGSAIGLVPEMENCDAIVQAWYPGQAGGRAIADVLFGKYNPSGKLPVTFYKNVDQLPDFEDYNMTGRTYQYFKGEALFPFGYGLSYTNFKFSDVKFAKDKENYSLNLKVKNSGSVEGTEVIQVYLSKPDDKTGPVKSLRLIRKLELKAGEEKLISIDLLPKDLYWWNDDKGKSELLSGNYILWIGGDSQNAKQKIKITL